MAKYRQPRLAADCIIRYQGRIVLIERRNPPAGWALPGGFVEPDETAEAAVEREMLEETGLRLSGLRQFRTYSEPKRDPRFECVSVVFAADGEGELRAGDDARAVKLVGLDELGGLTLAFDHEKILADYAAGIVSEDKQD
ncbi:NUDIX hydrolase [candidate division WOR-3 bacterium]|nr:NUDIX hydrolase [candidate division WOR-3 bacterium]